ncbi:MAG: hypothetical protein ACTH1B_02340 [Yaniella sp.]|uniref:hypothetical protein n=1 Tax=Yaniella sp. TaxID=2773929 RepID=UPI003F9C35FB
METIKPSWRRIGAGLGIAAMSLTGLGFSAAPSQDDGNQNIEVQDASFHWAINEQAGSGTGSEGISNWLVAGEVGDVSYDTQADNPTGWGADTPVWNDSQGATHFAPEAENVSVTRPDSEGTQIPVRWEERNHDIINGGMLNQSAGSSSWNQVNMFAGQGEYNIANDSVSIHWEGAYTMVEDGGRTYKTVHNPRLEVQNGSGYLEADLTGYTAKRNDTTQWLEMEPGTDQRVAWLVDVNVTDDGLQVIPNHTEPAEVFIVKFDQDEIPTSSLLGEVRDGTTGFSWELAEQRNFGEATEKSNGSFSINGQLPSIVVRNGVAGWTITGQAQKFTHNSSDTTTETREFGANTVGWAPRLLAGNPGGVQLGKEIQPGTNENAGLSTPETLATFTEDLENVILGANINIEIPEGVAPGDYTTVLTLTAIAQ